MSLGPNWELCYNFENLFAEKMEQKLVILTQNMYCYFNPKWIKILVYQEKRLFVPTVAKNRNHNVAPWSTLVYTTYLLFQDSETFNKARLYALDKSNFGAIQGIFAQVRIPHICI
jgi:hypothetical protein